MFFLILVVLFLIENFSNPISFLPCKYNEKITHKTNCLTNNNHKTRIVITYSQIKTTN